jgi:hypothetical protein
MANTYTKLGSYMVPLGSGGTGLGFSSIPQTYNTLVLHVSVRSLYASGYDSLGMYLNGVQTNLSNNFMNGTGTGTSSSRSTYRAISTINAVYNNPNMFTAVTITIPNYTSSTFKQIMIESFEEGQQTAGYGVLASELWSSTAAINSVTFDTATSGVNLAPYSTFTLYGLKTS